jgi:hypothetical protein
MIQCYYQMRVSKLGLWLSMCVSVICKSSILILQIYFSELWMEVHLLSLYLNVIKVVPPQLSSDCVNF